MDIVVVTRARDAHLLRFFLASYESFWDGGGNLFLVTRRADAYLCDQIRLPAAARLIYREDFPELVEDDFRNQLYLKLVAHQFVRSEHYLVMDSDFLFVAPCSAEAFCEHLKPLWFFRPWTDAAAASWRAGSEAFVGESIDCQYMAEPQYVLSRTVAAELCRRYDPRRILEIAGVSEFVVYGWFARRFFPEEHHWVDSVAEPGKAIGRPVNQVPPDYWHLDSRIKLDDFPDARYLAFWSHWGVAEKKMAEFLAAAQRRYPDRPRSFPIRERIYPVIEPAAPLEKIYSEIRGIDSDGWFHRQAWFAVEDRCRGGQLEILVDVPRGPIAVSYRIGRGRPRSYQLDAGVKSIPIRMNRKIARKRILLWLRTPPSALRDSSGRTLRARLVGLRLATRSVSKPELE